MSVVTFKSEEGPVVLDDSMRTVVFNGQGGPLAGASASVETAGELQRRVTVTRMALTGPLAFALKKKRDDRELYLSVEGQSFAFVARCDPKEGLRARQFAASINTAARGGFVSARASGGSVNSKAWSEYSPWQRKALLIIFALCALVFLVAIIAH